MTSEGEDPQKTREPDAVKPPPTESVPAPDAGTRSAAPAAKESPHILVLIGVIVGVVPVLISSHCQAQAGLRQMVLDRQLGAIKDFSSACSKRLHLAKRAVFLGDVLSRTNFREDPEVQKILIERYQELTRDIEDARVAFQAQVDFSNALFDTQLATPPESEPANVREGANLTAIQKETLEDLRHSIPALAQQCGEATKHLVSKLQR